MLLFLFRFIVVFIFARVSQLIELTGDYFIKEEQYELKKQFKINNYDLKSGSLNKILYNKKQNEKSDYIEPVYVQDEKEPEQEVNRVQASTATISSIRKNRRRVQYLQWKPVESKEKPRSSECNKSKICQILVASIDIAISLFYVRITFGKLK